LKYLLRKIKCNHAQVDLEVDAEKINYMLISSGLNSGQNNNTNIANRFFENVTELKYLGMTPTNQNHVHKEIKSRLNSGNPFCYSVENLLSSYLLSKGVKIKVCKTKYWLHFCHLVSHIKRRTDRPPGNTELRRIFAHNGDKTTTG
jgi:hypothetical protein